jgi:hypothetical protein
MKQLIFFALMLSFLAVNAQQSTQPSGSHRSATPVQIASYDNPRYSIAHDANGNTIKKPDNYDPGYPIFFDTNGNKMKKIDIYDPGYPIFTDANGNKMKRIDIYDPGYPIFTDANGNKMKIVD